MIVVTGLSVRPLIFSSTGEPQPGFFVSTTVTPFAVMKTEVLPPPPFSTYRLSFSLVTISALADGWGACCATAIEIAPRTSNEPRMMRRFMLCLRRRDYRSLVVLPIHPTPEQPAAERTQPANNVIHVSKVHQLDQIAVEIPAEEKGMAAGRALGAADDLDAFADEIIVPALQVADVEREMRQADAVPRNRHGRLLRLELEDLEHAAAGDTDPANPAGRHISGNMKEGSDALARRVRDADQRTAEHLPVEPHRAIEVGHRNADVAE